MGCELDVQVMGGLGVGVARLGDGFQGSCPELTLKEASGETITRVERRSYGEEQVSPARQWWHQVCLPERDEDLSGVHQGRRRTA